MEQHISISEADRRRGLAFVSIAAACIGFVLSAQLALNNNFLVGEIHISGFQAGLLPPDPVPGGAQGWQAKVGARVVVGAPLSLIHI